MGRSYRSATASRCRSPSAAGSAMLRSVDGGGSDEVRVDVVVGASARAAWAALTAPEQRRRWWPQLELDPRVGGRLVETWHDGSGAQQTTRGTVLDLVPEQRLRCSWRDDGWPAATEVLLTLRPAQETTVVELSHRGWDRLEDAEALRDAHRRGWAMHLADLRAFVERGAS